MELREGIKFSRGGRTPCLQQRENKDLGQKPALPEKQWVEKERSVLGKGPGGHRGCNVRAL